MDLTKVTGDVSLLEKRWTKERDYFYNKKKTQQILMGHNRRNEVFNLEVRKRSEAYEVKIL